MSTALPQKLITVAEFEALPDDGMERDLVCGQLVRERPMTKRNRFHAKTEAKIAYYLNAWLLGQPEPRGAVMSGEVGTILRRDPDTAVGIDVAFFAADVMSRQTDQTTMIDGAPTLAVEILSPSDKLKDINGKIEEYLNAQVPIVWIVDPHFQTVTVYSRDNPPQLFSGDQTISGGSWLPDLAVGVSLIFE